MSPAQRDSVRQLLFGGPSAESPAPRPTKADYAAELRAQVAAKEAARQAERENSLRQSAAHLALRQAAPSAVLPMPSRRAAAPLQPVDAARSLAALPTQPSAQQAPRSMQQHEEQAPAIWHSLPPPSAAQQYGWEDSEVPGGWGAAAAHHSLPPPAPPTAGGPWWDGAEQWGRHGMVQPADPRPAAAALTSGPLGGWPTNGHSTWQEARHAAPSGWMDEPAPVPPPPVQQQALLQAATPVPLGLPPFHAGAPSLPSIQVPTAAAPPNYGVVVAMAPFGNDLQALQQPPARSRSLRLPPGAGGGAAQPPPWVLSQPGAAASVAAASSPTRADGAGRLAAIGAAALEGQAARQAQEAKRAAYKAELEAQMAAKEERRRQERERERVEERRKAQEAALLLHKSAGGYGGGSGPLRGVDGRPITDLNQVRRFQEGRSQPGSPAAGSHVHGIPAHWGASSAADAAAARAPEQQHGAAFLVPASGMAGGTDPAPLLDGSPAVQYGWEEVPRPPAGLPPAAVPAAPAYANPAKLVRNEELSTGMAVGVMAAGAEQPTMRLRSDRPFQTASEAERRKGEQAEFQEALRRQVEEKARLRAEEQQRRKSEEAEEEARLAREQERLRQQFDADQARQRAKQAEKQAAGAETLESGGITIKFKPPPAQRQQQQPRGAAGAIDRDDAVPGVEIRMPRRPPPRGASDAAEAAPAAAPPRQAPVADGPEAGSRTTGQESAPGHLAATAPAPFEQQPGSGMSRAPSGVPPAWQQQPAPPGFQQHSGYAAPVQQPWGMPPAHAPGPAPGWGPGMPPPPMQQHGPPEWAAPPPGPWAMPPAFTAPPPPWLPPHLAAAGCPPAGPPWMHQLHHPPAIASAGFGMPPPPPATAGYGMPPMPMQHPWGAPQGAFAPSFAAPSGPPAVMVMPPSRPFMGPVFETTSVLATGLNASRPPTARSTGLPPLPGSLRASAAGFGSSGHMAAGMLGGHAPPSLVQRGGPLDASITGGSMLIFPPQAQQAQQDSRRQSLAQAPAPSMPQQGGSCGSGSRRASQLGPGSESAPSPPASGPVAAGGALKHWSSLREHTVPFSRQSSPTPPGLSQQEEAGQPVGQGSRRSSWGGAWAQVEVGAPGAHWPN